MGELSPDIGSMIVSTPRTIPKPLKSIGILLLVVGVAAAAFGFLTSPTRAMASFLINFAFWAGVSQGGFMFAVALVVTTGRWGRPLKRVSEAFFVFMPVLYVLLIVFLVLGGIQIFPWTHEQMPAHKDVYLQPGFFIARLALGIGLLMLLSWRFIRSSLRADMGVAIEQHGASAFPKFWSQYTDGWQGTEAEIERSTKSQARLGPVIAIAYAFVFSMIAIDIEMSLAPHWFANMFPAWYFASCFWSGLLGIGVVSLGGRKWLGATNVFTRHTYHDLGKLCLAFCMFWGYTTYATYLAIWYGNMTEEIGFILLRTELEPWSHVSKAVLLLCFFMPFAMFASRGLKKIPAAFLTAATVALVGIWLCRYIVVMPSVWMDSTLPLGIIEIGMTLGFLGSFILVVFGFLARVPPIAHTDPFMHPDPDHVHVVPASKAHAH